MKRYELNICFRDDTVRTEHSVWRPDPGTRRSDFGTSQQRHRYTSARQRILSLAILGLIYYVIHIPVPSKYIAYCFLCGAL
jgi:hypothetical protein